MIFEFSGDLQINGSAIVQSDSVFEFFSSWKVLYEEEIGFESFWNIGDGERYWYRVEGVCSKLDCEKIGAKIIGEECKAQYLFLTVVTARSLKELCKILNSPVTSTPVKVQIKSIKKYSRPLEKDLENPDECNFLVEQQFCQIPECFQYCIDEQIDFVFPFRSIQSRIYNLQSSSNPIYLSGSSVVKRLWPNAYEYEAEGTTSLIGFFEYFLKFVFESNGVINIDGDSENLSSRYTYISQGSIALGGYALTNSPKYFYSPQGQIKIEKEGYSRIKTILQTFGSVVLGGNSKIIASYNAHGVFNLNGLAQVVSPYYTYNFDGNFSVFSEAYVNRKSYGNFLTRIPFNTIIFPFKVEFDSKIESKELTIDDQRVSVECGCNDLPLFLTLKHQLPKANILQQFLLRNSYVLDDDSIIKYRIKDKTWSSSKIFEGFGLNSNTTEKWLILFELTCFEDFGDHYWKFLMYLRRSISNNEDFETKFLLSVPNSLSCIDNSLNLNIKYNINFNEFYVNNNILTSKVHYDEIGLFKNKFWTNTSNFVINIGPRFTYVENPILNLKPIFNT